jgi:AcrR family transcriptional regulator
MAKRSNAERTGPISRKRTAQARLTEALATLTQPDGRNGASQNATVTELCRLADVSRNSLYRYHSDILKALRRYQCRRPSASDSKARRSDEQRRLENIGLRERISQLAALVDHYHVAYREAATLIERRDRELAELRRRLKLKPIMVKS